MALGTFPAPPLTGWKMSVGFRPLRDSVSSAGCMAPRKMLRVTLHIYKVYRHMPATEFKVASSKKLVFQTAQASHVIAGLEVRRPGATTELRKPSISFPMGLLLGTGPAALLVAWRPLSSKGLRAGHLPSPCSCLPVLESIISLFP